MAEIYGISSDKFTQVEPTGEEEIQIGANKKTTLQAIADLHKDEGGLDLESPIAGFTPLETGGTEMDSTFSLLQALQMLYRIGGNGSIKMVGNSYNKLGLVSIGDNTLAGILFNTSNNTVYIRDTTTVVNAKQVTDLEIMNWITDGTKVVLGATPPVNPADIKMTGFTKATTTPGNLSGLDIQITDSLLSVIQKLYSGITDNGRMKLVNDGYRSFGIVMLNDDDDEANGIVIDTELPGIYIHDGIPRSNFYSKSDVQIIALVKNGSLLVDLAEVLTNISTSVKQRDYSVVSTSSVTLMGNDSKWYGGTTLTPTVTIDVVNFDSTHPEAVFVCSNLINPRFVLYGSGGALHLHTELSNLPTSGGGFKVYTVYLQKANNVNHFFVNGAPYGV